MQLHNDPQLLPYVLPSPIPGHEHNTAHTTTVRALCGLTPSKHDVIACTRVFQLPADDYQCAMTHLMRDSKFVCHVCCYNVPAAFVAFTVVLVLCLIIVPMLERRYLLKVQYTATSITRQL